MRGERVIYRGRGVVTSSAATDVMVIASVTLIGFVDRTWIIWSRNPGPRWDRNWSSFIHDWEEGLELSENVPAGGELIRRTSWRRRAGGSRRPKYSGRRQCRNQSG